MARALGAVARLSTRIWFRYRLRSPEPVPAGPVLFVGNHSGIGIADLFCLLAAGTDARRRGRRGVAMVAKQVLDVPVLGRLLRALGAVDADRGRAARALARGYDVAVFPGGDIDACRPVTDARCVYFGWRRAYVRIALEAGVPIVPFATIGSHYTYLVLPGGSRIARATSMRSWARCERFPLVLGPLLTVVVAGLAAGGVVSWWWVLTAAVVAVVPNPVRVTTRVLPAIDVCEATAHIADPEARVEAAHRLVHDALSRAVATLRHQAPDVEPAGAAPVPPATADG